MRYYIFGFWQQYVNCNYSDLINVQVLVCSVSQTSLKISNKANEQRDKYLI